MSSSMASSIAQYQPKYIFRNQLCEFPTDHHRLAAAQNNITFNGSSSNPIMWCDQEYNQSLPFFGSQSTTTTLLKSSFSEAPPPPYPERFGVSDMAVPVLMPEFNMGLHDIAATTGTGSNTQMINGFELLADHTNNYHLQDYGCDQLGEEDYFNGFVPDIPSAVSPSSSEIWGCHVSQVPAMEDHSMKVGKYSVEERKDRILRYLKKRNKRNFNKTIKYACRKTLADKRVRVRGRFARNNELCEGQSLLTKNSNINNPHEETEFYNDETIKTQIKLDGDDWLQEAMGSPMYFPYISG